MRLSQLEHVREQMRERGLLLRRGCRGSIKEMRFTVGTGHTDVVGEMKPVVLETGVKLVKIAVRRGCVSRLRTWRFE